MPNRRPLTILPLVAATYFMVAGGPYGLEELVQKTGFTRALIILLVTPVIWSLPTALMIGELSSAIPAEGGFYVWVTRALGLFWGFQEAWLSLVASIFDMALYPTLFVLYLSRLWPTASAGHNGVFIALAVVVVCVIWNLFGAASVGGGSVLMSIVLLGPFAVLIIFALMKVDVAAAHAVAAKGALPADLLGGILIAMWNYQGWDNASTVAGEVANPQRTYPIAMIATVSLVTVTYILPVGAVALTGVDPAAWSTGAWVDVATSFAGRYLGIAVVIGGMIGGFGAFNSLVMSYSRLPFAMAENGFLPQAFTRRLANGAPWVAIIVCGIAWSLALGLNFTRLIILDILLYGLSLILEFVALIALRIRVPQMPRPFRVPGGMPVAILLGIFPTLLIGLALVRNRHEQIGSVSSLTIGFALMAAGPVAYWIAARMKRRIR
jgi:amino acid transporter